VHSHVDKQCKKWLPWKKSVFSLPLGFMAIASAAYEVSKMKVKRSVWMKPWILQRPVQGAYNFVQWFANFRWFRLMNMIINWASDCSTGKVCSYFTPRTRMFILGLKYDHTFQISTLGCRRNTIACRLHAAMQMIEFREGGGVTPRTLACCTWHIREHYRLHTIMKCDRMQSALLPICILCHQHNE